MAKVCHSVVLDDQSLEGGQEVESSEANVWQDVIDDAKCS